MYLFQMVGGHNGGAGEKRVIVCNSIKWSSAIANVVLYFGLEVRRGGAAVVALPETRFFCGDLGTLAFGAGSVTAGDGST
jgi:hypothetical protein